MANRRLVAKSTKGNFDEELLSKDGRLLMLNSSLVAGVDFNYMSITNTDTNEDTIVKKTGGSSGTVVETLVIAYASGASKISDSFSELFWS